MEKLITFENGLRLLLVDIPSVKSITTGMLIGAGCAVETPETNGVSHFIEHTVFKGTKKRNSFEISDALDSIGGLLNAYTANENTCYYTKTTNEYFDLTCDVLSDMLFNSVFDKDELDKERGVILEEISMSKDSPMDSTLDSLTKATFGDTPLGRTILGTAENVKRFSKNDVNDYMSKFYVPNNIVLSVAGNFKEEEVINTVKKYFVDVKGFEPKEVNRCPKLEIQSSFETCKKSIEQAHIAFTFESCKFASEQSHARRMISNILGGGLTSRLFQTIREKMGLAYNISTSAASYINNGVDMVYAAVSPDNIEKTVAAIRDEIKKFKADGITKEEFDRVKAQSYSSFVFMQEQPTSQMLFFGKHLLFTGRVKHAEDYYEETKKITYDQLMDTLPLSFNFDNCSAALVGPKTDVDILKIIKE